MCISNQVEKARGLAHIANAPKVDVDLITDIVDGRAAIEEGIDFDTETIDGSNYLETLDGMMDGLTPYCPSIIIDQLYLQDMHGEGGKLRLQNLIYETIPNASNMKTLTDVHSTLSAMRITPFYRFLSGEMWRLGQRYRGHRRAHEGLDARLAEDAARQRLRW